MSIKKITALICTVAMIFSLTTFPVAANNTVTPDLKMIINDHFGNGDTSGWMQVQYKTVPPYSTLGTEAIGGGNYALTYQSVKNNQQSNASDWQLEFIKHDMPGDGLVFSPGVDTVIKTRIKQNGTGWSQFKFNLMSVTTDFNDLREWNLDWGTLFRNVQGDCRVIQYWNNNTNGNQLSQKLNKFQGMMNSWINVKVTIHGDTKTASYVITNDDGTLEETYNNLSIDMPDIANWEEDILKTLAFRLCYAEKLYVDYVQVWQEGVIVSDTTTVTDFETINVTPVANTNILCDLSDYMNLYESDGVTPVRATKTFDKATNTVRFTAENEFPAGSTYKVVVDTEGIARDIDYVWNAETVIDVEAPACVAANLSIGGKLIPGTALTADYDLIPKVPEAASEFIWYTVGADGEKTPIDGATGKSFNVTEDYVDSKITYSVIPKCTIDGIVKTGVITHCTVNVQPLSKPVADNLKYNRTEAVIGSDIGVLYDYSDADDDEENGSVITWYKGSAADSTDYIDFATGKTITLTEDLYGNYIKFTVVPKNNAEFRETGDAVWSGVIGPVKAVTNEMMIINDQFGDGDIGGWVHVVDETKPNHCVMTTEDIGEGNYALTYESFSTKIQNNESDWQFDFIKREGFGDGLVFSEGVDTIIKTRIKQKGTGLSFLKMNLMGVNSADPLDAKEWNFDWGTLFHNANGVGAVPNGWSSNGYMVKNRLVNNTEVVDTWLNIKAVIHGNTKTASYVITNDDGTLIDIIENTSIDYPDDASWEEAVLKNLAFRLRNPEKLYVDYIQVWQEGVVISSATCKADLKTINVKINANSNFLKDITECFNLYSSDGVTLVPSVKSFDNTTNTISFVADNGLISGSTYKIKVDEEKIQRRYGYGWNTDNVINVVIPDCAVINLDIEGKIIPGTELKAVYDMMPAGVTEASSEFIWYTVDSQGQKTPISGATSKTFAVTEAYKDSTITYSVIPKCYIDGLEKTGLLTDCYVNAVPLSKPVADDLKYNRVGAMIGFDLSATYNYTDADGDKEEGSIIAWYKGSAPDSNDYVEFATGKTVNVTEELFGMYLKYSVIPKNNALYRETGDLVWSEPIGPASDLLTASNLFVNSGFETGEASPWEINASHSEGYRGFDIVEGDAYSGNYAMRTYPRYSNSQDNFYQQVNLPANKTYLISAMVKSATREDYKNFEIWVWKNGGQVVIPYRDQDKITVDSEWKRITTMFQTTSDNVFGPGFISFETLNGVYNAEVLVDDTYLGELMITDIDTLNPEPVTIPKSGEVLVQIINSNAKIYNQLGDTKGLNDQKAIVLDPNLPGVKVRGTNVVIDPLASAGTIRIEVACIPTYPGPAQEIFKKVVELSLVAHDDKTPRALNVTASGIVQTGETLIGDYDFHQIDGMVDNSKLQWLYSDTENGEYKNIPGATGNTYVVEQAYADKFIKFSVKPETSTGLIGTTVMSDYLTKPTAPTASNITVGGDFTIGGVIKAEYKYSDINKDPQGNSIFKWYVSDTKDGVYTVLNGQNSNSLVLTENLTDKYIKFGVTPVSQVSPYFEKEFLSEANIGPTAPTATDVYITNENGRLVGNYTYNHTHNIIEKGTEYRWSVDGKVVSTQSSYVANYSGTKTITFTVMPSCAGNPSKGKAVSVSVAYKGSSGSDIGGGSYGGGGGASGGGGGGSNASAGGNKIDSGILNINDMKLPETEVKEPEKTEAKNDLNGHWGEVYVKEMETRGVMKADESGNFNPDRMVSRSEMISYLFDALKLEEAEYKSEFSDVSVLDGYAGKLQAMINNGTIASYHEFRPEDGISREEMCKILYVSLENAGKLTKAEVNVLDTFTDKASISDWAIDYVNTIYSNKIMIGTTETTFAPKENITRAQVATMLVRILKVIEG